MSQRPGDSHFDLREDHFRCCQILQDEAKQGDWVLEDREVMWFAGSEDTLKRILIKAVHSLEQTAQQ